MTPKLFDTEEKTLIDLGLKTASKDAIALVVEQGSQAWFTARLGIITASEASNIVTTKGEPTKGETRKTFLAGLIAERLTKSIQEKHETAAMERGQLLEPRARAWYAFKMDAEVQEVGFIWKDKTKTIGASPDGLIAAKPDRGLEVKCPMNRAMVKGILKGGVPTDYMTQIQVGLWVTGLSVWDFVLYTPEPEIPSIAIRVDVDESLHPKYKEHFDAANQDIEIAVKLIQERAE